MQSTIFPNIDYFTDKVIPLNLQSLPTKSIYTSTTYLTYLNNQELAIPKDQKYLSYTFENIRHDTGSIAKLEYFFRQCVSQGLFFRFRDLTNYQVMNRNLILCNANDPFVEIFRSTCLNQDDKDNECVWINKSPQFYYFTYELADRIEIPIRKPVMGTCEILGYNGEQTTILQNGKDFVISHSTGIVAINPKIQDKYSRFKITGSFDIMARFGNKELEIRWLSRSYAEIINIELISPILEAYTLIAIPEND